MEKPYYPPPSSDEINLLPILRYIKRKIDGIFDIFGSIFYLMRVHTLYLMQFIVLGLVVGAAYMYLKVPVYKSTAIYTSNLMNNQYNEAFINELRWLSREKNYEELSKLLVMDYEDVKNIKKIEYESFEVVTKDSLMSSSFKVHAYVKDVRLFDSLQYKLLHYMENNIYANKRRSAKEQSLRLFSEKMNDEIVELDSIKKIVSLQSGQLNSLVETYRQVIELYMERYKLMERMALMNNYELIQEFSNFRKPYSPRLRELLTIVALFGVTGLFFANYRDKKKKLASSLENRDKQSGNVKEVNLKEEASV